MLLLRYLDDWLVVVESRDLLLQHSDLLLQLCEDLGIIVNWEKSDLQQSTHLQYLGMLIDMSLERVFPSQACCARFWEVAMAFLQLPSSPSMDVAAAAGATWRHWNAFFSRVTQGPLVSHSRRPGQSDPSVAGVHQSCTMVSSGGKVAIQGSSAGPSPSLFWYTNASLSDWGVHLLELTASGVWSEEESVEHINMLEMKAVALVLAALLHQLLGKNVILINDNASVVAYLQHQGSTVSQMLCLMASEITRWIEWNLVQLSARYILGRKNILAGQPSCPGKVLPKEWSVLLKVFKGTCSVFDHLDLFAARVNVKLPLYVFPVPDPLAWKQDAFQSPVGPSVSVCLPTICVSQAGSLPSSSFDKLLISSGGSAVVTEGMFPSCRQTSRTSTVVEPSCSTTCEEVPSRPQRLIRMVGFSRKVVRITSSDLRRSTAAFYQSKWTRFLGWCD